MNKDLATMIDNKRYILNDADELVNKIAEQKIGKNNALKPHNNMVNKAEQITELRSTSHRQKMSEIFNYLEEFFNGPTGKESASWGEGLKILTQNQMLSRLSISLAQLKTGQGLKTDALKTLYTNLVKEQKLKKQYCSENNEPCRYQRL